MKVAMPNRQGRISPVFDTAANLLIAEVQAGRELGRGEVSLTASDPLERAREVSQLGADVLICGALSWPLEMALSSADVQVIAQVCGDVEQVLTAFREGKLAEDRFLMPGCCRRRRYGRRGARKRRGTR